MTDNLKDLMERASDRPAPYAPDVDSLLATGRRQARKHQLTVVATAAVAVAALVGGTSFAVNNSNRSTPDPAHTPSPTPALAKTICETDEWDPADISKWHFTSAEKWPEAIVSVADPDGMTSVRRSAEGSIAYCSTWVEIAGSSRPLEAGSYRVDILTRDTSIHTFTASACDTAQRLDCNGSSIAFAGRLPAGVTRVTVEGAGRTADAIIKDGYYVFRLFGPQSLGKDIPTKVRMYNSAGTLVVGK